MSPLVEEQLARARRNFSGRIYLVKDHGNSALVCLWPDGWWRSEAPKDPEDAPPGDWVCMSKPFFMLIDPAQSRGETPQ